MLASHEKLRSTIEKLHNELANNDSIDAATADELRLAIREIEDALAERAKNGIEGEGEETAVGNGTSVDAAVHTRLSETARKFEASHPVLSRMVGQVVDMLGQMGV